MAGQRVVVDRIGSPGGGQLHPLRGRRAGLSAGPGTPSAQNCLLQLPRAGGGYQVGAVAQKQTIVVRNWNQTIPSKRICFS